MDALTTAYNSLCSGMTMADFCARNKIGINKDELFNLMEKVFKNSDVRKMDILNTECKNIIESSEFGKYYDRIIREGFESYDDVAFACMGIMELENMSEIDCKVAVGLYEKGYTFTDAVANALSENYYDTCMKVGIKANDLALLRDTFEIPKDTVFIVENRYYSDMGCEKGIGHEVLENWFSDAPVSIETER